MRPSFLSLLLFALFAILPAVPTVAQETGPTLECGRADDDGIITCPVRLDGDRAILTTVLSGADGVEIDHDFLAFEDAGEEVVIYMLFDIADPARQPILRDLEAFAGRIIGSASQGTRVGIATYGPDFTEVVAPTDRRVLAQEALAGIEATGSDARLFDAIDAAIDRIEDDPAPRRVILVFSDGQIGASDETLEDVVERAAEVDVQITTFGSVADGAGEFDALEQLAQRTGGLFTASTPGTGLFPDFLILTAAQMRMGGGAVQFAREDALDSGAETPLGLTLEFVNQTSLRYELDANLNRFGVPTSWLIIGGGVVAILVFAFLFLRSGRGQPALAGAAAPAPAPAPSAAPAPASPPTSQPQTVPTPPPAPPTAVAPPPAPEPVSAPPTKKADEEMVYAILNGPLAPPGGYKVTSTFVTIGRSEDSAFVLDDSSVSRRHATLSVTPEGKFQITDLKSLNGVRVNGEMVEVAELHYGDRLQLGEVVLTFGMSRGM